MKQELVIPNWLPPPVLNGSRQKHWATIRKEVQDVKLMVWASAKHARWEPVQGRARVTVTFVHPVNRTRDEDNTMARAKHVIDGLRDGGWITDDGPTVLERIVKDDVRRGERATVITLEAI